MATVLAMTSVRLFRVILPVDDLERAVEFYRAVLADPGTRVSGGRHYFRCGDVTLAIYSPAGDHDPQVPRPNVEHVYFAVDDLEGAFARAESAGGLAEATGDGGLPMGRIAVRPWGERSFYLHDPFGNPLCFVDARTVFTGPRP
jgi:catechol 2,3-dioxygenase-like lactoylglutathione lyase family enzyme